MLVVGACARSRPQDEQRTKAQENPVVPWVETEPPPPTPVPAAGPPAAGCRTENLTVSSFEPGGTAAGTAYAEALLRNDSSRSCLLNGDATVTFLDRLGHVVQPPGLVNILAAESFILVPSENDLRQGIPGAYRPSLRLAVPQACPPPIAATRMEVALPEDSGSLVVAIPARFAPPPPVHDCEAADYSASFSSNAPPPPEPPLSPLEAAIIGPDTVGLGERLRFLVRISNPTSSEVDLEPCPVYGEGFKGEPGSFRTYQLNCSTVQVIPAHSSVTYEMYLDVPTELVAIKDRALLTWGFEGGDQYVGPFAEAMIGIRT